MYRVIFFLLTWSFITHAIAQTPFSREFWLNEQNTPVQVNDIFYEQNGYVWLATDDGVYSFDGRRFTKMADSAPEPATALGWYNGAVLAGYKSGALKLLRDGRLQPINIAGSSIHAAITSITTNGILLVITSEEGVHIAAGRRKLELTTQQGLSDDFVYDALALDNKMLFSTDRGINILSGANGRYTISRLSTEQGLPDNIVRTLAAIPGEPAAWAGTQEGGLALVNTDRLSVTTCKMSMPWAWGQVNDILALTGEEAWVATEENYLLKVNRHGDSIDVTPYTFEGTRFRKLIRDKAGNIWCATNYGLLLNTALFASQIRLGDFRLSAVSAVVYSFNRLWYTQDNNLFSLPLPGAAAQNTVLSTPAPISCLHAGTGELLWIGTLGSGLFSYSLRTGALQHVEGIPELDEGHVLSITGVEDRLWVASLNGVEELKATGDGSLQRIKHHDRQAGLSSDYVYQLFPDSKGNIWMATDGGGVCMYDGNRYASWDSSAGLKSDVVYSLTEDKWGNIWAGTLGKALYRYDQKEWKRLPWPEQVGRNGISTVKANNAGNVFVVTDEGIFQWWASESQLRVYNSRLGIHIDSTSAVLNLAALDRQASLYVPFKHGFVVFPEPKVPVRIAPDIRINKVSLFFKPLAAGVADFSHDENHLSFRYEGINFSNPGNIRYRYMLEGYDNSWINTSDEVIAFAQLPPRTYRFRVQASLTADFSGAAEDSYSFTISRPFYSRIWFLLLLMVSLFGVGYLYVRIRERGLRKMARLQKERMVFEYEHLKSQVNPHFLFNSLNTLVSLIDEDKDAAVDYTVHLSDLYRNMLSFKDQDLIPLSEEYKIIRNYMFIQRSRFGDALKLEVSIPEQLLSTKKVVPLALQLLVENAIKHNVVSMSRPLTIYLAANDDEIVVRNHIQPKVSKEKGAGLGLINIKRRYDLLTHKAVKFSIIDNEYIVTLPLL